MAVANCDGCVSTCRAYNEGVRFPEDKCTAAMLDEQDCETRANKCNVWECNHSGGCHGQFSWTICSEKDELRRLNTPPANVTADGKTYNSADRNALAKLEMLFHLNQPTFDLESDTNTWILRLSGVIRQKWRDSRMRTAACRQMRELISTIQTGVQTAVERADKEAAKKIHWYPHLSIGVKSMNYLVSGSEGPIKAATFTYYPSSGPILDTLVWEPTTPSDAWRNSMRWFVHTAGGQTAETAGPNDGGPTGICIDCISHNLTFETESKQPKLDFKMFPFDEHRLAYSLSVKGADIFSCPYLFASMKPHLNPTSLLPKTGEWVFASKPGYTTKHPRRPDGTEITSSCDVELHVKRDMYVFYIKKVLTSVLLAFCGLSAVFLHPQDHTGDRVALILTAALIMMVSFQEDLGIGRIAYVTWFDIFNLMHLLVLMVSLAETYVEHHLVITGRLALQAELNAVARYAFLVGMYPCLLGWWLMVGYKQSRGATVLFAVGIPVTFVLCAIRLAYKMRLRVTRNHELAYRLGRVDRTSADLPKLMREACEAYDTDGSGELELDEVRDVLKALFPELRPFEFSRLMLSVQSFSNKGSMTPEQLSDGLVFVLETQLHVEVQPEPSEQLYAGKRSGIEAEPMWSSTSSMKRRVAPTELAERTLPGSGSSRPSR